MYQPQISMTRLVQGWYILSLCNLSCCTNLSNVPDLFRKISHARAHAHTRAHARTCGTQNRFTRLVRLVHPESNHGLNPCQPCTNLPGISTRLVHFTRTANPRTPGATSTPVKRQAHTALALVTNGPVHSAMAMATNGQALIGITLATQALAHALSRVTVTAPRLGVVKP